MALWRWTAAGAAMRWTAAGAAALLLAAGCDRGEGSGFKPGAPGSLLDADRRFAAATTQTRAEGWVSWFAEDGAMLVPGEEVRGHEAIREVMQGLFADPTYALTWEPEREEMAAGGDLGYTVGRFRGVHRRSGGGWVERTGRYVSVWRRGPSGWQVVLDVGVPDPVPPEGAPAEEGGAAGEEDSASRAVAGGDPAAEARRVEVEVR